MFGSIHTHLEDRYDAVSDIDIAILSFVKAGMDKIVSTSHGSFTQFIDAWSKLQNLQKMSITDIENKHHITLTEEEYNRLKNFEIIPGVECYFGENKRHLILIARDEIGYQNLCNIITDSYFNNNITTYDILKKSVKKGHIFATSACQEGILNVFEEEKKIRKNISKYISKAIKEGYLEEDFTIPFELESISKFTDGLKEMDDYDNRIKMKELYEIANNTILSNYETDDIELSKSGIVKASSFKKFLINNGIDKDTTMSEVLDNITNNPDYKNVYENYILPILPLITDNKEELFEKNKEEKVFDLFFNTEKMIFPIKNYKSLGKRITKEEENKHLFLSEMINYLYLVQKNFLSINKEEKVMNTIQEMQEIFGDNCFLIELQSHKNEYNENEEWIAEGDNYFKFISKIAMENNIPVIGGNDIHLGVLWNDKEQVRDNNIRRNIMASGRFNTILGEHNLDDYSLAIKDKKKMHEDLSIYGEEIADKAISNIGILLNNCHYLYTQNKGKYIPKVNKEVLDTDEKEFEELKRVCYEAFNKHIFENNEEKKTYKDRLEYELKVIKDMGFSGYHLIVKDYIEYGKELENIDMKYLNDVPLSIPELKKWKEENKDKLTTIRKTYVGPGRGSACGSLVCYLCGITDIDPLPYDLLFERYLNPFRHEMPDIDSDFATENFYHPEIISIKEKIFDYCGEKYHKENIAHIMAKGYIAEKGSIKTAASYIGCKAGNHKILTGAGGLADAMSKEYDTFLNKGGDDATFENFCKIYLDNFDEKLLEEDIRNLTEEEQKSVVMYYATKCIGSFSNYGEHACGMVISSEPLKDFMPLMLDKREGVMSTLDKHFIEDVGLLKMDVLGLESLSIISDILALIDKPTLYNDYSSILSTDNNLISDIFDSKKPQTEYIFQFSGYGCKAIIKQLAPKTEEDLIFINALNRPGSLPFVSEAVNQKRYNEALKEGKTTYEKMIPGEDGKPITVEADITDIPTHSMSVYNDKGKELLGSILDKTYGVPIYQEQIMQIFQKMAGFDLGSADLVRRAMSKKQLDVLMKEKDAFVYGDETRGIKGCIKLGTATEEEAKALFENIIPFSKYGFNKSHATAYATIAVRMAYLKKNFPNEFYTVTLDYATTKNEKSKFENLLKEMLDNGYEFKINTLDSIGNCTKTYIKDKTVYLNINTIKGINISKEDKDNYYENGTVNADIKKATNIWNTPSFSKDKHIIDLKEYLFSNVHRYTPSVLAEVVRDDYQIIDNSSNKQILMNTQNSSLITLEEYDDEKSNCFKHIIKDDKVDIKAFTSSLQEIVNNNHKDNHHIFISEDIVKLIGIDTLLPILNNTLPNNNYTFVGDNLSFEDLEKHILHIDIKDMKTCSNKSELINFNDNIFIYEGTPCTIYYQNPIDIVEFGSVLNHLCEKCSGLISLPKNWNPDSSYAHSKPETKAKIFYRENDTDEYKNVYTRPETTISLEEFMNM